MVLCAIPYPTYAVLAVPALPGLTAALTALQRGRDVDLALEDPAATRTIAVTTGTGGVRVRYP